MNTNTRFLLLAASTAAILGGCAQAGADSPAACAAAGAAAPVDLSEQEARESYSLGSVIGEQLRGGVGDVDGDALLAGIADAYRERPRLEPQEVAAAIESRREREIAAAREALRELAERNRQAGDAFREQFGQEPEVVTLASGLQYKVLHEGEGAVPGPTDTVKVHYRGTLVDGTEFDSSHGEQPVQFPVDRVIPGWSEALQQMSAGSKWQVVIPPDLAYGEEGAAGFIEPNQTLVFEVELLEVG